jgi:hypothetical protein
MRHLVAHGHTRIAFVGFLKHTDIHERYEGYQAALVAQQASLQEAYNRERILAATIREIGAPIIPLLPQVLLIPLIGTIDTARAQQLIEATLQGISSCG